MTYRDNLPAAQKDTWIISRYKTPPERKLDFDLSHCVELRRTAALAVTCICSGFGV